jgi:hypothetical protein
MRRMPVVQEVLDGDLVAVGEDAAVDDAVAALPDDVLGCEGGGGLLQLPERVPVPPPEVRHLGAARGRRHVGRHGADLPVGAREHAAALAGLDVHALRPVRGGGPHGVPVATVAVVLRGAAVLEERVAHLEVVAERADVDGHLLDLLGHGRDGGRGQRRPRPRRRGRARDALPGPPPARGGQVEGDEREEQQEGGPHRDAEEHPQAQPQHRRPARQLVAQQRRGRGRHCRRRPAGQRAPPARRRSLPGRPRARALLLPPTWRCHSSYQPTATTTRLAR